MLKSEQVTSWLHDADEELLNPFIAKEMTAYPISTMVNSPKKNNSDVLKPMPAQTAH